MSSARSSAAAPPSTGCCSDEGIAPMNPLEWVAAALGVVNVALVVRRSVWNYPFGLAMVSLYFFVFFEARLYSDALLQIFFFAVQLYGWRNWLQARAAAGEVTVTALTPRARLAWAAGTAAASLLWGLGMARFTDAAAPMIDAAIAGTSIAAQILMAQRRIENWVLWILIDMVAIGLFASRGLYATSALYMLFLLLSMVGLLGWRRALPRPAAA
jgi:nicotinamide mononucleotide transporter